MSSAVESMEQELSCTLCLELYNNPVQLPCLHSYCYTCLEYMLANSNYHPSILKCPNCRKRFNLRESGLNGLQKNFKLASIVEIYKQMRNQEHNVQRTTTTKQTALPIETKLVKGDLSDEEDATVIPVPDCIIDGHMQQLTIDSDLDEYDSFDSEWDDEEYTGNRTFNQDFNFLWTVPSTTVTDRVDIATTLLHAQAPRFLEYHNLFIVRNLENQAGNQRSQTTISVQAPAQSTPVQRQTTESAQTAQTAQTQQSQNPQRTKRRSRAWRLFNLFRK